MICPSVYHMHVSRRLALDYFESAEGHERSLRWYFNVVLKVIVAAHMEINGPWVVPHDTRNIAWNGNACLMFVRSANAEQKNRSAPTLLALL
jgi:hypothetical protein